MWTRTPASPRKLLPKITLVGWLLVFLLSIVTQVWAQAGVEPGETFDTNPKERQTSVSAIVPDNTPPSTPILISPSNNAVITNTTVSFVWEASTDDIGIANYQLFLDGNMLFNNIPTTSTITPEFTLTYDAQTKRYTLTPTTSLTQTTHTWKIRAIDTTENVTDSATWSFTIDTQAPSFVLTQIGTANVTISAHDVGTIPASPIELTANEPLLLGTGEANSTVQLTLIIPGEPTQYHTNQISPEGNWGLQLGILPRDVVMTMDFLITDLAGNLSVLNGVMFYIKQDAIIIPPSSPAPTPPTTPGLVTSPPPGEPPTSPPPSPLIAIPITPPREVIFRGLQQLIADLPEPLVQIIENVPESIKEVAQDLAPVSALIVAAIVPIASTVAVATQFGGQLSLNLLIKILQALGLLPAGKPQGLVFDTKNGEGVPFAVLIVSSQDAIKGEGIELAETVVTDSDGIYQGLKLPSGNYTISVTVQDYLFPTKLPRPPHLRMSDFYKGETFALKTHETPTLLIPVDPLTERIKRPLSIRFRVFLARLSHYSTVLIVPLFLFSLVLAIMFPSWWNWLIVTAYLIMLLWKVAKSMKKPIIVGTVVTDDGQPSENVIVRIRDVENNQVVGVSLTDKWGKFRYYGTPCKYEVSFQKQGYAWMEGGSPLSFEEIDATSGVQELVITLTPLAKIYQEMGL